MMMKLMMMNDDECRKMMRLYAFLCRFSTENVCDKKKVVSGVLLELNVDYEKRKPWLKSLLLWLQRNQSELLTPPRMSYNIFRWIYKGIFCVIVVWEAPNLHWIVKWKVCGALADAGIESKPYSWHWNGNVIAVTVLTSVLAKSTAQLNWDFFPLAQ